MKTYYFGIDIGTSAAKIMAVSTSGEIQKVRCAYTSITVSGWEEAVRKGISELATKIGPNNIRGISLSSQVGTYITDTGVVLNWWESAGEKELAILKSRYTKAAFLSEISMNHPDIVSYPLPRLMYIREHFPDARKVYMPKEHIVCALTGNLVSDVYSYRGLFNFDKREICKDLLKELGLSFELPRLLEPCELAGYVTDDAAERFGLAKGTPVYVGMNDFFAGLVGMGVTEAGDAFDLSGTSEHIGVITTERMDTGMVSGAYIKHFATYGGTKNSGLSCSFAVKCFGRHPLRMEQIVAVEPPVFLPYLQGERAPIFDEDARGVFFGMSKDTSAELLYYSVMEGVVFSLFDIAQNLGMTQGGDLICGGGASVIESLSQLKADMFAKRVINTTEPDVSALGAAMTAMVGNGVFPDYKRAARAIVKYAEPTASNREYGAWLLKRFNVYKEIYKSLRPQFKQWHKMSEEIK